MNILDFFAKLPEPIISERLILRKFNSEDVDILAHLANNKKIKKFRASLPHPYTKEHAIDFINNLAHNKNEHAFAITLNGEFIGTMSLYAKKDKVELGYWLGEPFWGNGYATEAVKALIKTAKDTNICPPTHALVITANIASINVLKKCGFIIIDERIDDCGVHKGIMVTFLKCR